jgi:uracil-DNA glycosylase family 4
MSDLGRDLLRYARDLGWRHLEAASPMLDSGAGDLDPLEAPDLESMSRRLADCRRCGLCERRRQVVFGVGNVRAQVMFVGEGPGADEDRIGEPFVGRAGRLLNQMLRAMGLARDDVYIANVVKCRPPGNRDPRDDEAATCLPFLYRQVDLVDPLVVVTLGRIAARYLLGTTAPIGSYRGRWKTWRGRALMPTFHPAYLLRTPSAKAEAWSDLKAVRDRVREVGAR